jgi:pyruvate kinase
VRHTKIVATVGPACDSDDRLRELVAAGVDVFRLNFSHGTHEGHAAVVARIRAAAERVGRIVAILQDLSGPKIRTGTLEGGTAVDLVDGATLRIATGNVAGTASRVSTTYAALAQSVRAGDRLLLDDGKIELRVEGSDGQEIVTTVLNGGPLGQHKGISAPGVTLPASSLTGKDLDDLQFGISQGVDVVALSFVQSAADVIRVREAAAGFGAPHLPVIAKIERPEAVAAINGILDV